MVYMKCDDIHTIISKLNNVFDGAKVVQNSVTTKLLVAKFDFFNGHGLQSL